MSPYQKGKTNLDFTEVRDSEWQWHQLGNMQVCISLQTDNLARTPPLCFLQAGCPSCHPTNSVKALKAKVYFYSAYKFKRVGRRVFRECLEESKVSPGRRSPGGRSFHSRGLAAEKLLSYIRIRHCSRRLAFTFNNNNTNGVMCRNNRLALAGHARVQEERTSGGEMS